MTTCTINYGQTCNLNIRNKDETVAVVSSPKPLTMKLVKYMEVDKIPFDICMPYVLRERIYW